MAGALADTNLLLRLADNGSPVRAVCIRAVERLEEGGHNIFLTPQTLIEFWAVATRPVEANGLAWPTERTHTELDSLRARLPILPDCEEVFGHWLPLVASHDVKGKHTHDARLAAVMGVYGIRYLLTFNGAHFATFPDVIVLDPAKVASGEIIVSD
jgi:predicted nucleic acid-binding protein